VEVRQQLVEADPVVAVAVGECTPEPDDQDRWAARTSARDTRLRSITTRRSVYSNGQPELQ
jgi:hypothetical protein